ncbi:MAG TPA: class I SAM-dependent methyltransferase [Thermoanaerobaculia bacterium]
MWPIELLELFLRGRQFDRALSIGCGTGTLERQLIERGMCRSFDAFDGSVRSLMIARREADSAGLRDKIRYFAADFNEPALPRSRYEIVFFHQSAHHVGKLEKLYRALMRALKPGGLVYFDEYVGPSRFEWATQPDLLDRHKKIFEAIPPSVRAVDQLKPPIQMDDPSEAIRSSEIEPQLRIGFDILGKQTYGGGILSIIIPSLRIEKVDAALLQYLIDEDRQAPPYHALMLATPKRGFLGAIARARYWLEPKVKHVVIELRRAVRGF